MDMRTAVGQDSRGGREGRCSLHPGENSFSQRGESVLVLRVRNWSDGLQSLFAMRPRQASRSLEAVALEDSLEGCLDVARLGEPSRDHRLQLGELRASEQDGCGGEPELQISCSRFPELLRTEKRKKWQDTFYFSFSGEYFLTESPCRG